MNEKTAVEKELEVITYCGNCVFNVRDTVQTGCQFNRLERFIERKAKYNIDDAGNYELTAYCSLCRDEKWADKFKSDMDALKILARNEAKIPFDSILLCNNIDELGQWFEYMDNSDNEPHQALVVTTNRDTLMSFSEYTKALKTDIPTTITYLYDASLSDLQLVDKAQKKCQHLYYVVFDTGKELPEFDVFSQIDNLINDDLRQPIIIYNEGETHLLSAQNYFHKILNGTSDEYTIIEKGILLAKEQKKPGFIMTWEELWQKE